MSERLSIGTMIVTPDGVRHVVAPKPIVCLPLMTKPTREVEKGTKYLPEVWKPNG